MARSSTPSRTRAGARLAPALDSQTQAIVKRLDALAERAPDLAGPAAFYRAVLLALREAQAEAQAKIPPVTLDREAAQRKLESGLPLLVGEDLPLDVEATRDLFLRLCRIAESASPDSETGKPFGFAQGRPGRRFSHPLPSLRASFLRGPLRADHPAQSAPARDGDDAAQRSAAAAQIRGAVERNELDLLPVWEALALGDGQRVEWVAAGLQLDAGLLRLLAENSLKPSLRAWSRELREKVDVDHWLRGQCPMCGSLPLLSEIQGKEGERRLRCGMCGAGWYYLRLKCAFCGNQDHRTLGTISVEGEEEKYRVQTCDKCRGYLKIVVTFDPTPVDLLAVEDLATLHLDLIAAERAYVRAPVRSERNA